MRRCLTTTLLLFGLPAAGVAGPMDDLVRAYPEALSGYDGSDLIWRDGTRMPVDDKRPDKSLQEQLAQRFHSRSDAAGLSGGYGVAAGAPAGPWPGP